MDKHRLARTLIHHESIELNPYLDSEGYLTIGVGHKLDGQGITEKMAMFILDEDINSHLNEVKQFPWFDELSDVRQEVILNLHFNVGHTSFLEFKKMISALERKDYTQAAEEMIDSKWYDQVRKRAEFLVEAMITNEFTILY